ncbi:glycosyltransferase family 9 protein [Dyadobacter arcticus]|uniref:Heptosyltransferase-2 n=1 Tax=Dyadobacter arcticus TaxID=1078754 RepID=A0ABX0UHS7_9BACT|nr:glycosyltransferase family 9 protein [Dyadobacter arcticus]NIJ52327.1 heptosyltransferase-2 [Dyadobacter arcticus]
MRIVILKCEALGDVLRTTPLATSLFQQYPNCEIIWIARGDSVLLLEHNISIKSVYSIDLYPDAILSEKYDWVISLEEDTITASLATKLDTKKFSGVYIDLNGQLNYTTDMTDWFSMSLVALFKGHSLEEINLIKRANKRSYLEILYECLAVSYPIYRPVFNVGAFEKSAIERRLESCFSNTTVPVICIFMGGSNKWARKPFTPEQVLTLVDYIKQRILCNIIVLGGINEEVMLLDIQAKMSSESCCLGASSISELATIISISDLLITTDSLPLHLANTQAKPFIALFGPTSSSEIDCYDRGIKIETLLKCKCCYLRQCIECLDCRDNFNLDSVVTSAVSLLENFGSTTKFGDYNG